MPTDPGYRTVSTNTNAGYGRIRQPKPPVNANAAANSFESRVAGTTPKDTTDWIAMLNAGNQPPPGMPMPVAPGNLANRSGRGGGGGGGAPAIDPAKIKALAGELYGFNAAPYDLMRQQVGNQRTQAQGYNPDFAAMGNEFTTRMQGFDQQRAADVTARLQQLAGFGQALSAQQSTAMQGALRDLTAQGINTQGYMDQANQVAGERTAGLANQGQYMGQLNAAGANAAADYGRASGLITQGAQANLANNRGTLLNQLAQQDAQIGLQQAQAQQQNEQARREFMLKYGVL